MDNATALPRRAAARPALVLLASSLGVLAATRANRALIALRYIAADSGTPRS